MLEAPRLLAASIEGPVLARVGVSLRENEKFSFQHCPGSGGSRLRFGGRFEKIFETSSKT